MIKIACNAFQKTFTNSKQLTKFVGSSFASNSPFEGFKKSTPFYDNKDSLQTRNVIAHNVGLKSFLTRTYNTTALSICGALGAAYVGMSLPALMMNPGVTSIVGGIAMIGSFMGMNFIQPRVVAENQPGVPAPVYKTENPISRLALYSIGVASMGLSASPFFLYMHSISPSIITSSIGITMGIFGGASAMAYMLPKDKMLGYGGIFTGSLIGLIAMQLVGLGSAYFMGPNALSTLLFDINTYGGLLLFSGLIAYDTHVAIKSYESGYADHLGISVQLVLNFWNILLRVMQIMSKFRE